MSIPNFDFDFDEWARLARTDVAAFEQRRLALIETVITQADASYQLRLRRLQWRIDMERRRTRTPMQACLRLSSMMWDSLLDSDGLREALDSLTTAFAGEGRPQLPAKSRRSAQVIAFTKHQNLPPPLRPPS